MTIQKTQNMKAVILTAVLAILVGLGVGLASMAVGAGGCGSSSNNNSGGGGAAASTDAAANTALVTSFVAQGNVAGIWTNNNFGSTGDFSVQSSFDQATKMFTITVDVNGSVFGGADPAPETFQVDMTDFIANGTGTINVHSDSYGDITVELTFLTDSTGTFTATATNVPGGVTNGRVTGSFSIGGSTVAFRQDTASFTFGGQNITVTSTIQ